MDEATKMCSKCGVEKPLNDFYPVKGKINKKTPRKLYRQGKCKACQLVYFAQRYRAPDGKIKQRIRTTNWIKKHPDRWRNSQYKKRYGITLAQYQEMLESQGGACAICGRSTTYNLHVDHNHATGRVRGLLCQVCNRMLGHAKDDPDILIRAARYLESHECE